MARQLLTATGAAMTDAGFQLDMFKRVRASRAQRMAYRDRGWNARGDEVCWFECPKCGAQSGMRKWRFADAEREPNLGPECHKCNREKR